MNKNSDARLKWFGSVPEKWLIGRNKNAFQLVNKKVGEAHSDYELLSLTLQGIIKRDIESGKGKFPASFDTYQEVKTGDIVFCLFDVDETPRTVGLSPYDGMVTGAYTVVRCTKLADPRYVTYFYLSIDHRKGLRPFYTGLRKVVRPDTFFNLTFPLPSLNTQRTIADFLDRETARIDELIEKKQRLVELLEEKLRQQVKSIVLVHAQGLVLQSLRWSIRVRSGDFISNEAVEKSQSDTVKIPVVGGNGVMAYSSVSNSPKNTLVVGRVGALCGNAHLIKEKSWVTDNALVVTVLNKTLRPEFLYEVLLASNLNEQASKSAQPLITGETVKRLRIAIPDPSEQANRVRDTQELRTKNANLREKIIASIDRLREFRSALITAAVTAQFDVDEWSRRGHANAKLDAIVSELTD